MVCEAIFNLYGTSSDEIREKQRQEDYDHFAQQISALTETVAKRDAENSRLRKLLAEHGISAD